MGREEGAGFSRREKVGATQDFTVGIQNHRFGGPYHGYYNDYPGHITCSFSPLLQGPEEPQVTLMVMVQSME